MTIQLLESFGISITHEDYKLFKIKGKQKYIPQTYNVEADWSGGAFLLVAGAIKGDLNIEGLRADSKQSDMAVLQALDKAGAKMSLTSDSIRISESELKAFEFDATESPDLFPPLAALAAFCNGTTKLKGVSRLKFKESDRAQTLKEEFGKLKIDIRIDGDQMYITGGNPSGGHVESHDDHRIAMAMAVTALGASESVFIRDSQCVAKSYPSFFDDLRMLGAKVHE
jgi:3-phosphoshikimate 1-carboxyvinyltransferase